MLIPAASAIPLSGADRRLAACFAASLIAHALTFLASLPVATPLQSILPPINVRLVQLPPPALELPRPVPAPPPPVVAAAPRLAGDKPAPSSLPAPPPDPVIASVPAEPAPPRPEPAAAFAPPMTEREKARLDPRYQPQSAVDRAATALDQRPAPEYPPEAMAQGLTGCVLVVVYVGESGKVENLEVLRSDPPKIFDRAAMRAFVNGRYLPALKGNAPVRARIAGVASFELEGKPSPMCALRYFPLVSELGGLPPGGANASR